MDAPASSQSKFLGPRPPTPPSFSKPSLPSVPDSKKTPTSPAPLTAVKPSTPAVSEKKSEEVVIRTMKDDLANLRQPGKQEKGNENSAAPSAVGKKSAPLPTPLPNQVPKNGKPVFIPAVQRKSKGRLRLVTSILVGLILIAVVGVGVWYLWENKTFITQPEAKKDIQEMIPASAVSVVEYKLDGENRSRVSGIWAQQSIKEPTFDTLLGGDPRLLISSQDVDVVYYIQLTEETRPFLLIPVTSSTEALFENSPQTQYKASSGWFVAHPVNPDLYVDALKEGSMKNGQAMYEFSSASALRIYLSAKAVAALRPTITGSSVEDEGLQNITIRTDADSAVSGILAFDGIGQKTNIPLSILKTDPTLLSFIPSETTFAYAGHDLAGAIEKNSSKKDVLNADIINQAAVKQLLQSFKGEPYVVYRRTQDAVANTFDVGMVIKVPTSLATSLQVGDKTLETALLALVPTITGNQRAIPSLAFADGVYSEIPLRYVNIAPGQAIDYAIVDSYILVASSKEGMFLLLDAVKQKSTSTLLAAPSLQLINDLIATSATSQSILITKIDDGILKRIIPAFSTEVFGYITILFSPINETTQAVSGLLVFPEKQ